MGPAIDTLGCDPSVNRPTSEVTDAFCTLIGYSILLGPAFDNSSNYKRLSLDDIGRDEYHHYTLYSNHSVILLPSVRLS